MGKFEELFERIEFNAPNINDDNERDARRQIEDDKSSIEKLLRGVINYYNQLDDIDPRDGDAVNKLHNLKSHLLRHLGSYSEFT